MIEYPVQLLRKNEVNVIAYLDDLIFWGRSKGEVIQAINLAKETFARLGFIINQRKSVLKPTRIIVWLGLSWETQTFSIGLPRTFRMKLLKYAAKTVTEPQVNRRSLEASRFDGLRCPNPSHGEIPGSLPPQIYKGNGGQGQGHHVTVISSPQERTSLVDGGGKSLTSAPR